MNRAAQQSREAFEAQMSGASFVDTLWDPAGFAHKRIDVGMQERLAAVTTDLLGEAASELRLIDEGFAELAAALEGSAGNITFPCAPSPADQTAETSRDAQLGSAPPSGTSNTEGWGSHVAEFPGARSARAWSEWAADAVAKAGESAGLAIKDRTGLHDRLRFAAVERVRAAWLGYAGTPRPVLAQLLSMIDDVASSARNLAT